MSYCVVGRCPALRRKTEASPGQCAAVALLYSHNAPLAVRVLDVQPDDVERDVVGVEAGVHGQRVGLVAVVPSALVVAQRKQLRSAGNSGGCQEQNSDVTAAMLNNSPEQTKILMSALHLGPMRVRCSYP